MIEEIYIEELEDFMDWYVSLNPEEFPDMHEAMTIFFNQETYKI